MAKEPLTRAQVLILLEEGPQRIAALTNGLTPAQLRTSAADGGWSATEILAHLRACADMWGAAIAAMLAEEHPTLRAVNPRKWVKSTDYADQQFAASFAAYAAQRDALLAVLQPLPAEAWARTATVTGAGAPLARTVHFYAQWLASHERTHFKHIARVAKEVSA